MDEQADERRPLTLAHLLDVQAAVLERRVDARVIVDDAVLDDLLQLRLGHAKRGVDLVQREHEVAPHDLHRVEVVRDAGDRADLVESAAREERRGQ